MIWGAPCSRLREAGPSTVKPVSPKMKAARSAATKSSPSSSSSGTRPSGTRNGKPSLASLVRLYMYKIARVMLECRLEHITSKTLNGTLQALFLEEGMQLLRNNGSTVRALRNDYELFVYAQLPSKTYVRPGRAAPDMTMTGEEINAVWRKMKAHQNMPPLEIED